MRIQLDWGDRPVDIQVEVESVKTGAAWEFSGSVVAAIVAGDSKHSHGTARVSGAIFVKENEVFDLFTAMLKTSNKSPELRRVCLAAVKELKTQHET